MTAAALKLLPFLAWRHRVDRATLRVDLLAIRELYVALRYGPAPVDDDLRLLKYRVGRLRP